jgi:hypothetical protein
MKRISILAISLSALLLAGSAYAQDATTRGGAQSTVPSTKQNSPATGAMTAPGANTNTSGSATTSGQSGTMAPADKMEKPRTGANPPSQGK